MAKTRVKTIDRLVELLNCFDRSTPVWSLASLSRRLQVPRSTLHRFLVGLETQGVVRRNAGDARWLLGPQLVVWGALAADGAGMPQAAAPVTRELPQPPAADPADDAAGRRTTSGLRLGRH